MLKMSTSRTNTCFSTPSDLSLTLPNPRWRISIAVVLIFPTSTSLLAISVLYTFSFMQPQRKKSNGVRPGDLAGQATGQTPSNPSIWKIVTFHFLQKFNTVIKTTKHTIPETRLWDLKGSSYLSLYTLILQGVSKGQVNPYGGDSGPYLEQKFLIHFFRIRPCFWVTWT